MTRRLGWLVLAGIHGGCQTAKPPSEPARLVAVDSVGHLDQLVREPMVVRHRSGALFVSGYWDPIPPVYRSTDDGATWRRLDLGAATDGAAGNSDIDLAVGPDGTVYLITLVFDRANYRGIGIRVAASRDTGATWSWTSLSETPGDDRPWIEVAPDGTVHAIWNDGQGVSHALSADGGRTWTETERANSLGGSSHLAVGPAGEVAVRYVPMSASGNRFDAGVEGLAVSDDRGTSWRRYPPPAPLAWYPLFDTTVTPPVPRMPEQPRWVEPLAWDSTGALFAFWAVDSTVWLGRSLDKGGTWQSWPIAVAPATAYYPYLVARGNGELAASWITGKGAAMRANLARIAVTDSGPPSVALAEPFDFESYTLPGFGPDGTRDAAGEYLPVLFLADGSIGIVTPIQHVAASRMGFMWRRYRLEPATGGP
ncbi:MAG: exo-alpha-sialidase [Gemmatimonadetes bacterium]|nr:exo-alpha-sialidase [Gemmatimonadota bacterium]